MYESEGLCITLLVHDSHALLLLLHPGQRFPICYCKFGNFRENFIFANSVTHICDIKNSCLEDDLAILTNDRVISPFREDFIFEKIKPSRKFPNLQTSTFFMRS